MFYIDDPTAAAQPPATPAAGTEGWFTGGNPALDVPATRVRWYWLNMIQAELGAILAAAPLARSKLDNGQVLEALRVLFIDHPTLQAEVTARGAGDTAEALARNNEDVALSNAISTEATTRYSQDVVLGGEIAAEATTRNNVDVTLSNAIAAEGVARNAEDQALQAQFPLYALLTQFANNLTVNGGTADIANGLMIAWAHGTTSTGNNDPVPFPPGAFPTALLSLTICEGQANGWNISGGCSPTIFGYTPNDRAGFHISCSRLDPTSGAPAFAGGVSYSYIAVGF